MCSSDFIFIVKHFGKSKVSYLRDISMQENVLVFEIAVNNSFFMQSFEAVNYLFQEKGSFVLCQSFTGFFLDIILERSVLAVLHDNEHRSVCLECINEPDDIGIISTGFHDFDLSFCELPYFRILEMLH